MIGIVLNGQARRVESGLTLESLLARLELPAGRVAVERNRQVVPRARYGAEPIEEGDRLEIVTLVGGG
ncbi:MAG TPA: sulfur carrier protein ThiS [Candidatus Polarisedimenticolia bacterium]|nr:sulfur carrier protein ThiS [Candidatus Polarisedimenticolia bacterium]